MLEGQDALVEMITCSEQIDQSIILSFLQTLLPMLEGQYTLVETISCFQQIDQLWSNLPDDVHSPRPWPSGNMSKREYRYRSQVLKHQQFLLKEHEKERWRTQEPSWDRVQDCRCYKFVQVDVFTDKQLEHVQSIFQKKSKTRTCPCHGNRIKWPSKVWISHAKMPTIFCRTV